MNNMITNVNVSFKEFLNLVEDGANDYAKHQALCKMIDYANALQMEIDPDPRAVLRREAR